jgi:ankyrin repeat protein
MCPFSNRMLIGFSALSHLLSSLPEIQRSITGDPKSIPLLSAVQSGRTDLVVTLLEKGADIGAPSAFGRTALHIGAATGHKDVVLALLDWGADIHETDPSGYTALHLAAESGKTDVVMALLRRRANVTALGKFWNATALHLAAACGRKEVLIALLDAHADINALTSLGQTSLHCAVSVGYLSTFPYRILQCEEAVNVLLERGANLMARDEKGNTPLHFAAATAGSSRWNIWTTEDRMRVLLEKGADPNAQNNKGVTAAVIFSRLNEIAEPNSTWDGKLFSNSLSEYFHLRELHDEELRREKSQLGVFDFMKWHSDSRH